MPPSRNRRACERCRQHKSRCLPGSSTDTCSSCERIGSTCIAHVPEKRGLKAQKTIRDLSNQVVHLQTTLQKSRPLSPISTPDRSIFIETTDSSWPVLGHLIADKLISAGVQKAQCLLLWNLDISQIKDYLDEYNSMAIETPFSVLAGFTDISLFIQESTIFVLAAMLVAPHSDYNVAQELDLVFHRILTDQAMVRGHQSLDIISGLTTYLMWIHHRYDPQTQQFYQYLQLSKAMVEDLQLIKLLETEPDMGVENVRKQVERLLVALCYIDRGTVILDTKRHRPPMSVEIDRLAATTMNGTMERLVDEFTFPILNTMNEKIHSKLQPLLMGHSLSDSDHTRGGFILIRRFWKAWYFLQKLSVDRHGSQQTQGYLECFDALSAVIEYTYDQPIIYLQTMTIVEWGYLLASLVKLPHLEILLVDSTSDTKATVVPSSRTINLVNKFRLILHHGQQLNPLLFERSKHLWWLTGILSDIANTARTGDVATALNILVEDSVYEALEQLTERLTGYRKGIQHAKVAVKVPLGHNCSGGGSGSGGGSHTENELLDQMLAEWVDFD